MAVRPTNLTVLSQTPVNCYRASATASELRRLHLCRVQPTASANRLEQRFSLNNGRFWGYAFSLPQSEIFFYQLKAGESFGPLTPRIAFTSSDWAVITLITTPEIERSVRETSSQQPRTRDQQTQTHRVFKEEYSFPPFTQEHKRLRNENTVTKTVTYTQWETKSTPFCRWVCRVSRQTCEQACTDDFVIDLTNSQSGVFSTLLRIPTQHWLNMMAENNATILNLFKMSKSTTELVMVGNNPPRSTYPHPHFRPPLTPPSPTPSP